MLFRNLGQGREENGVFGYVVYMLVRNVKESRTCPPLSKYASLAYRLF